MPRKIDGSTPVPPNFFTSSKEGKEALPITSIPEELTRKGITLLIDKLEDGRATGEGLVGGLLNGPIEVGKRIRVTTNTTTEVVEINQIGNTYLIKTKSGSEYHFDPSNSIEG